MDSTRSRFFRVLATTSLPRVGKNETEEPAGQATPFSASQSRHFCASSDAERPPGRLEGRIVHWRWMIVPGALGSNGARGGSASSARQMPLSGQGSSPAPASGAAGDSGGAADGPIVFYGTGSKGLASRPARRARMRLWSAGVA